MTEIFSFSHSDPLAVYDAREKPFRLYGLYRPEEKGTFKRMPTEIAEVTSRRVRLHYKNPAGARLRFATDSEILSVVALFTPTELPSDRTAALCAAGACFFDLYADGEHVHVLWHEGVVHDDFMAHFSVADGHYESTVRFPDRRMREITLCFPTFVNVSGVYVGLDKDAKLREPAPYRNEGMPVVFYGSSITQGACASRSGNLYENILARKLNLDFLNLGFASGCKAEERIIDYLCTLPMSMLVFDYDHNAPSAEFLKETHLPALRKLRAAHPDVPFVVLSKPNRHTGREEALLRAAIIEESCCVLAKESEAPVHFVNGQDIFLSHDSEMMTVDGTHPTDLGFHCMAEALLPIMSLYFPKKS